MKPARHKGESGSVASFWGELRKRKEAVGGGQTDAAGGESGLVKPKGLIEDRVRLCACVLDSMTRAEEVRGQVGGGGGRLNVNV